jgi:hypothetical protein
MLKYLKNTVIVLTFPVWALFFAVVWFGASTIDAFDDGVRLLADIRREWKNRR